MLEALIKEYKAQRPTAEIEEGQHSNQGENSVVYRGFYDGKPSIFKFSIRNAAQRESDGYRRFENTSHVPRVFDVYQNKVIVTEFIEGHAYDSGAEGDAAEKEYQLLVTATQKFFAELKGGDDCNFGYISTFRESFEAIYRLNQNEYFDDEIFADTFDLIQKHWDAVSHQDCCFYYDDFDGRNMVVAQDKIYFIDMESVWPGNRLLQVGTIIANMGQAGPNKVLSCLLNEIQSVYAYDFEAAIAAAYLKVWVRICKFHNWNFWSTCQTLKFENFEREQKRVERFKQKLEGIRRFASSKCLS